MSDFSLFQVVNEYRGLPLKMVLTGAGSYAARLMEVPGASRVLDSVFVPYSEVSVQFWVRQNHPKPDSVNKVLGGFSSVSLERITLLHETNCAVMGECQPLTITAAITSKTPRRGKNHAFIAVGPPNAFDIWHVQLHKLDDKDFEDPQAVETRRFIQDRIVSEVALSLATGLPSALFDEMSEGGYVQKF